MDIISNYSRLFLKKGDKNENKPLPDEKIYINREAFYRGVGVFAAIAIAGGALLYSYAQTSKTLLSYKELVQKVSTENSILTQKAGKLEEENAEYSEKLEQINEKAVQLEQKVNEMGTIKEELYKTLDEMSLSEESLSGALMQAEKTAPATYTNVVYTPLNRTVSIDRSLDSLEAAAEEGAIQLAGAAESVKTELAAYRIENGRIIKGITVPSLWPVQGRVTSEFSVRNDPFTGARVSHKGMDIAVATGTPVAAAADGTVVIARWSDSFGYYVRIDHGSGIETIYGHNSALNCRAGQKVAAGQIIAYSGSTGYSTGPHVHYEVLVNGTQVNPRSYL